MAGLIRSNAGNNADAMARMHTKRKGNSKSRKPVLDSSTFGHGTEKLSKEQIEGLILDYAKQGMTPAMIGERLKREHDVKYVRQATGKRMVELLKEKGAANGLPQDMLDLMKKAVSIRKHLATNAQDMHNRLALTRAESKIWRLTRYYIREGTLPAKWRYDPKEAELLIKGKG